MKNKKYILLFILLLCIFGLSLQAKGQESGLKGKGNFFGMSDSIKIMKADFLFLEQEIFRLEGECRE